MMIDKRAVAIDHFSNIVNHDAYENAFKDSCKIAIEAIEKQVPKEPKRKMSNLCCPICNTVVYFNMKYCSECGQKLDWEYKQ